MTKPCVVPSDRTTKSKEDFRPILSVCVPTYNRAVLLKECLESVTRSRRNCEKEVEIVISDNASVDATFDVANDFVARFSNVAYYRNEKNVNDDNFFRAAARARGRFVWILGDDDALVPDAIPLVLDQIQAGHSLIICQVSVMSKDMRAVVTRRMLPLRQRAPLLGRDVVLSVASSMLGFISSAVINRQELLAVPAEERAPFIEYGSAFLYVVYACMFANSRIGFVDTPVVLYRSGNSEYSDERWVKVFVTGLSLAFNALVKHGYSAKVIRRARNRNIVINVLDRLASMKVNGDSMESARAALAKQYRDCTWYWIACVPVLVLPRLLLRNIRLIKRLRLGQAGSHDRCA